MSLQSGSPSQRHISGIHLQTAAETSSDNSVVTQLTQVTARSTSPDKRSRPGQYKQTQVTAGQCYQTKGHGQAGVNRQAPARPVSADTGHGQASTSRHRSRPGQCYQTKGHGQAGVSRHRSRLGHCQQTQVTARPASADTSHSQASVSSDKCGDEWQRH